MILAAKIFGTGLATTGLIHIYILFILYYISFGKYLIFNNISYILGNNMLLLYNKLY